MDHSIQLHTRILHSFFFIAFFAGMIGLTECGLVQESHAQNSGIPADGRDFYIGFMPGIPHPGSWNGSQEVLWVLIGSYQNNNTVSISYFDQSGNEFQSATKTIQGGRALELPLDQSQMSPARPGEQPEFKAAHIKSKYPVTVQVYSEGSCAGGMYQAVPTSALGKSYAIASWFDNPLQNNPGFINRDSSSSEFMIIAAYDNTKISFIPNSTTNSGVIGMNSGPGHTGAPHPFFVTLNRGQVYWVRSLSVDPSNDLSGSTILSDKPIAVLGGQERALLGDPSGYWTTLDNDIRDAMVEEMTPVESWGSDYPSIPSMPAPEVARLLQSGEGDMYRVFTKDKGGLNVNLWDQNSATPYPRGVSLYQSPAATYENILDGVDLNVTTLDTARNLKKAYIVQYQYFQGQHDFDPGGGNTEKGGTPQGNGGDKKLDETTYRCANEMDVVPYNHFQLNTIFKIPQNSSYLGYQFINIITYADSLTDILVSFNGNAPKKLSNLSKQRQYNIPLHPELVGLTYQLPAGDYLISGNTPFACYSYGRTQGRYKDGWGYAAPCGQAYGTMDKTNVPRIKVTPSCDHWDIHLFDRAADEGIADVMMLEDPNGYYAHPAHVSYNVSFDPNNPPNFVPGDTSVSFTIDVNDLTQNAYAALWVVDRAGHDTIYEFHYTAQNFAFSATKAVMSNVPVGTSVCSTFSIRVVATGAGDSVVVGPAALAINDPSFTLSTVPSLPATLKVGDSVRYTICFASTDTMHHFDSIPLQIGCLDSNFKIVANGVTPIIVATDWDFGNVPVGTTACHSVKITNVGNAPLIIDTNWIFANLSAEFSFSDDTRLPDTILPGKSDNLNFCFHPTVKGNATAQMNWGTNLVTPFLHHNKDTSVLLGYAIEPGLNWDRPRQGFTVICEQYDTERVYLINPSEGATGSDITVTGVHIIGPDASEFAIIGDQPGYMPLDNYTWPLAENDSIWVDLQFHPDLAKLFATRHDSIVAIGHDASGKVYTDTLALIGNIRHAILNLTPASYDFGTWTPGIVKTTTFTLTNTGDTTLVFTNLNFLNLTGTDFKVLSGPNVGDTLQSGGSVSVVVQYTAPASGTSQGSYTAISDHPACTPQTMSTVKATASNVAVLGTGHDYHTIYICQNGTATVTASNRSTKNVRLDSVQIVGSGADQFAFSNSQQSITVNQLLGPSGDTTFNVTFNPNAVGPVDVQIIYTFDTISGPGITYTDELKGVGYQTENTVSLQNPTAAFYTAQTKQMVDVPVQLMSTFSDTAKVYGAMFSIRYLRDQFEFQGLQIANGINLMDSALTTDPTDVNYQLLKLKVQSQTPILQLNNIAHLSMEYVVAKDTITSFQVRDLAFLDSLGNTECWVKADTIPGPFYGTNLCGDNTVRTFMRTGQPAFSIEHVVPNPVTNTARIDYQITVDGTPVTIEAFNALGQNVETIMAGAVHAKGGYQTQFDASALPSGMYTIRFSAPGYEATKSILVTK
jgi:hypothetical protein